MGADPAPRLGEGERLSLSQTRGCAEGAVGAQGELSPEHGVTRGFCSEQGRGGSWPVVREDLCNSLLLLA